MQAPAHGTIGVINREKRTRLNILSRTHGAASSSESAQCDSKRSSDLSFACDSRIPGELPRVSCPLYSVTLIFCSAKNAADLRLADLHRREVRPPALGSMVKTHILDAGNGHGIDPTQLAEDLQPGINNDFLARCQEVVRLRLSDRQGRRRQLRNQRARRSARRSSIFLRTFFLSGRSSLTLRLFSWSTITE